MKEIDRQRELYRETLGLLGVEHVVAAGPVMAAQPQVRGAVKRWWGRRRGSTHPADRIAGLNVLALAGDIRIATTNARLGFPEARLGNTPAWGGVPRLTRLVGVGSALDILLTGDPISAGQAERIGIVQRLCDPQDLETALAALIDSLLACDTATQAFIKASFGDRNALIAAQEAAIAGFTATQAAASERKQAFLASRRRP